MSLMDFMEADPKTGYRIESHLPDTARRLYEEAGDPVSISIVIAPDGDGTTAETETETEMGVEMVETGQSHRRDRVGHVSPSLSMGAGNHLLLCFFVSCFLHGVWKGICTLDFLFFVFSR